MIEASRIYPEQNDKNLVRHVYTCSYYIHTLVKMKGTNHLKYAVCHAVTNAVVSAGERENMEVHSVSRHSCRECKALTKRYKTKINDTE